MILDIFRISSSPGPPILRFLKKFQKFAKTFAIQGALPVSTTLGNIFTFIAVTPADSALLKKKRTFSSYIRKFRRDQVQIKYIYEVDLPNI